MRSSNTHMTLSCLKTHPPISSKDSERNMHNPKQETLIGVQTKELYLL